MNIFKISFLSIFLLLGVFSCKTKETTIDEMLNLANSTVVLQGNFQSGAHTTTGIAKITMENNKRMLVFENFKTDPGPDLLVYVATSTDFSNAIEIDKLKASNGNFSYEISASINLEQNKYVLIWCKQFSVLFGSATLAKK